MPGYKLEEHSQQGLVKDESHLVGSRGSSSKQTRMASECGPMHPRGCGLNQGPRGHLLIISDADEQSAVAGMFASIKCKFALHVLYCLDVCCWKFS